MTNRILRREQVLDVPVERAFDFFSRAENLEAITPPLLRFRITTVGPIEMGVGTLIRYRLRVRGIPVSWLTRIEEWEPPVRFVDRQVRGPYALWHHTHTFEPTGNVGEDGEGTLMTDVVRYRQRFGPLGAIAERLVVRRDLERIFDFRRDSIPKLLATAGNR
ncbi:MAG: SRPBCC family protein [Solirubrobacterales bacterium]|nr:SRPBCC family protein [Solirubrobacterales bacterium]